MNKLTSITLIAGLGAMSLTACGGSDGGGSAEGFCDSLIRLEGSDVDPGTDFEASMKLLDDVKSNAPSEIKGDLDTFIDVLNKVNDIDEDTDPSELDDDFKDIAVAAEKIQEYADANCDGLPADLFG